MGRDVTVIIPTLDRREMLSRALASALAQEDVELEVVIVDDGSSEPVEAGEDPRVRVVRHERPQGVARARNAGLAEARGEWVAFLDDDDTWAPAKLREQLAAAQEVGAGMAFSASVVIGDDGRVAGLDPPPATDGLLAELLRHNHIPGGCSNVIARTALVREAGGFDDRLSMLADWDLWIRLAARTHAAACAEPHVGYLDHADSMHVREARTTPGELVHLAAKHRELLATHGIRPEAGVWVVSWAAAGEHRAGHPLRAARMYARAAVRFRSKGMLLRALTAPFSDRLVRLDSNGSLLPAGASPGWLAP
ncbi:MAG: glycosyltransferase family 2 protein [Solirubrobacteraceae bacterium]